MDLTGDKLKLFLYPCGKYHADIAIIESPQKQAYSS